MIKFFLNFFIIIINHHNGFVLALLHLAELLQARGGDEDHEGFQVGGVAEELQGERVQVQHARLPENKNYKTKF